MASKTTILVLLLLAGALLLAVYSSFYLQVLPYLESSFSSTEEPASYSIVFNLFLSYFITLSPILAILTGSYLSLDPSKQSLLSEVLTSYFGSLEVFLLVFCSLSLLTAALFLIAILRSRKPKLH